MLLCLPCWLSQFSFSKLKYPIGPRLATLVRSSVLGWARAIWLTQTLPDGVEGSLVETEKCQDATKKITLSILFLYYEKSLSSNLNSNLLWFHCAHPNVHPNVCYERVIPFSTTKSCKNTYTLGCP